MVLPKNCRTPLKRWNPSSKFYSPNRLQLLQERFTLDFQPRRVSRRRTPALKSIPLSILKGVLTSHGIYHPLQFEKPLGECQFQCCYFVVSSFFSVRRLRGFRQVVQHVSEHVAIVIN